MIAVVLYWSCVVCIACAVCVRPFVVACWSFETAACMLCCVRLVCTCCCVAVHIACVCVCCVCWCVCAHLNCFAACRMCLYALFRGVFCAVLRVCLCVWMQCLVSVDGSVVCVVCIVFRACLS